VKRFLSLYRTDDRGANAFMILNMKTGIMRWNVAWNVDMGPLSPMSSSDGTALMVVSSFTEFVAFLNKDTVDSRLSGGGLTGLRINRGLSGLNEN
jgi:hypothetical protein